MDRERFSRLVARALDSIPEEFRQHMHNVAVLVEEQPRLRLRRTTSSSAGLRRTHKLLLGVFEGVPATKKSVFDVPLGPDRIVLYQKNIKGSATLMPRSNTRSGRLCFTNSVTTLA